jgi:RNA polymerase sigma-70 factor (ECF subfamily)
VAEPTVDAIAFERYVVPEIDVLLRVANSLTGNRTEAEDLTQDTLLRAFRGINGFDGKYPRAWVLTILRNTHINRNRRRRPELVRDPDAGTDALAVAPSPDRTDAFVDNTIDAHIVAAMDGLDDQFRRVVELVDIDGLSYAEAAAVLDVPVGTVMSRLHRARSRIRDRLDRPGLSPRSRM